MVSHVHELFEIDNFSVLPTLIRMVKSKMVGLLFAVVIPIQFSLAICGIIVFGFQRLDNSTYISKQRRTDTPRKEPGMNGPVQIFWPARANFSVRGSLGRTTNSIILNCQCRTS